MHFLHACNMWRRAGAALALLVLCATASVSCVDEAYDLKNISLKMTLGADGVTLPLGSLDRQTVHDMLEDSGVDMLNLDTEEGYYAYRLGDTISETVQGIAVEPVERLMPEFEPRDVHFELSDLSGLGKSSVTLHGDAIFSEQMDETFGLPDEVAAISFASVYDASMSSSSGGLTPAQIFVSMTFDQMPFDQCYFQNVRITLPSFLVLDDCEGYDPESNSILVDKVEYTGPSTHVVTIPIRGMRDVTILETADGKLGELNGSIQLETEVVVVDDLGDTPPSDLHLRLVPEIELHALGIADFTGRVDIDLQQYLDPTTIDFGDLSEALGDENLELNLIAPQIELSVNNPIGIPMVGDVRLQPYDLQGVALEPVTVRNVRIEAADGEQPRMTRLYITDATEAPDGYTLCRVENLAELMRMVPSRIEINFDLDTDQSEEHHIVVSAEDYQLDIDYQVRIPLAFRDNATIEYVMTEDVAESFSEIDKYEVTVEDVLIRIATQSTLPLSLSLSADLLTADGQPVEEVQAVVTGQIEGCDMSSSSVPRESQLALSLKLEEGKLTHLQQVGQIRLRFQGVTEGSNAALAPGQYLSAKMTLLLQKGITFDLDELLAEE